MGAPSDFGKVLDRRKAGQSVQTETANHGSKNPNIKNPDISKLPSFPGDFELLKLTLTSPNRAVGGYIDLKGAWSNLNIYEDVFANCLTGSIQITDAIGLMETIPIIGEETIHVHVRTRGFKRERGNTTTIPGPFKDSESEGIINLKFRVTKLEDLTKLNDGMVRYTLHLISEEYIINLKSKVMKSSLDPGTLEPRRISAIVKSLYTQFFKRGRIAKKIFIEPTKNPSSLVIPNYPPFKAFNFLASRAVSAGQHAVGSSFLFYETVKGFFFVSLETLMAGGGTGYSTVAGAPGSPTELVYTAPEQPVKETYVVQPKRMKAKSDDAKNVAIELTAVDEYKFSSNFDVLENLTTGMYSNRLLTHDLVRMKYDTLDFNMHDPSSLGEEVTVDEKTGATEVKNVIKMSAEAKNFSDNFTHLGKGKLCSENQFAMGAPESVISFYPTNFAHDVRFPLDPGSEGVKGTVKGQLNIIPNRVEQWMQSRMVQSQQLNNIKLNIRAPGMSTRTVGDLIEFKMPTQDLTDRDGETQSAEHKYLSGYYLITKLRHHFTKEKYEIEFEAIKDTLKDPVGKDRSAATVNTTTGRTGPK
jgi:hypothetical protein